MSYANDEPMAAGKKLWRLQHPAEHKNRSRAKKFDWARASQERRGSARKILDGGRAKKHANDVARIRGWRWDALKRYLAGAQRLEVVKTVPGSNLEALATILRQVGIADWKKGVYDRGQIFTRKSATRLIGALGYTKSEFTKNFALSAENWSIDPKKALNPKTARLFLELRSKILEQLMQLNVHRLPRLDRFDKAKAVGAVFPNLTTECHLLQTLVRKLRYGSRSFAKAEEMEIANQVLDSCSPADKDLQQIVRWLPQLMPHIIILRDGIAGNATPRNVAHELLGRVSQCSSRMVRRLTETHFEPLRPRDMRELMRKYVNQASEHAAPQPGASKAKVGPKKKSFHRQDQIGEQVRKVLPRFEAGFRKLSALKQAHVLSDEWVSRLQLDGYSPDEANALVASRKPESAAVYWVWIKERSQKNITLRTLQNLYSKSRQLHE